MVRKNVAEILGIYSPRRLMADIVYAHVSWERMSNGVERLRLMRAARALAQGSVVVCTFGI